MRVRSGRPGPGKTLVATSAINSRSLAAGLGTLDDGCAVLIDRNDLLLSGTKIPQIRRIRSSYGKFRPKFQCPVQRIKQAFELVANENAVLILPTFASYHSPPGVVILPLADAEVTWKFLVVWRRGRTGGALKALLDALFAKVSRS